MKNSAISYLLFLILISACNNSTYKKNIAFADAYEDTIDAAIVTGSFTEGSPFSLDSSFIRSFFTLFPDLAHHQNQVLLFYSNRGFELAWYDSLGKIEATQILLNRVMQMAENGLSNQIPYWEDFKRFHNKQMGDSIVYVDVMQTAQYFQYAKRVLEGTPEEGLLLQEWHIPRTKKNLVALLEQMIRGNKNEIDYSFYPQYPLLKKELIRLKQIQQAGGWSTLEFGKKVLRQGDTNSLVAALKKRLTISGEWLESDTSWFFTSNLSKAVSLFQQRHGLVADGVVGKTTIQTMNIPIETRIEQVIINMERCRWLPNETDGDYLLVNIPSFNLMVMHGDSLVFECEAIVGKETNRTAIFKGMMKYIVFNPYWNIPDQILEKEIIPALSKNKDYLKKNHMEWHEGRLRQLPGPDNALGAIKFLFPNPFDIYLHDTPTKGLFKETKRAFSHGCIRIAAPYQLASYLLRNQKGWSNTEIDKILETEKEHVVKLEKEIPVYILYLTAFVDIRGKLNFRDDLYQKDPSLIKILLKNYEKQ